MTKKREKQLSSNGRRVKSLLNGTIESNEDESTTATHFNMDEFQIQNWVKEQVRKEYTQFGQNFLSISHILLDKIKMFYKTLYHQAIWPHLLLLYSILHSHTGLLTMIWMCQAWEPPPPISTGSLHLLFALPGQLHSEVQINHFLLHFLSLLKY